jgi:hypothetical protein
LNGKYSNLQLPVTSQSQMMKIFWYGILSLKNVALEFYSLFPSSRKLRQVCKIYISYTRHIIFIVILSICILFHAGQHIFLNTTLTCYWNVLIICIKEGRDKQRLLLSLSYIEAYSCLLCYRCDSELTIRHFWQIV